MAIILCFQLTWQQLGYWRNSEVLFRHALAVTENNYLRTIIWATRLMKRGKSTKRSTNFGKLLARNQITPTPTIISVSFSTSEASSTRLSPNTRKLIRLKPDDAEVHCNLGIVLGQKGQIAEAVGEFQEAIRLRPEYAEAHYHLGVALGKTWAVGRGG